MKVSICAISGFALATIALGPAPERTVSTSRQFIVYGTDTMLRGAISHLGEETKANLLKLLQRSDAWETPIVINLQFPQANLPEIPPAALRFSQTGAGLKLQLDLTVAANFNGAAVERELLRALLLEMIYRKQPKIAPGTAYVEPPDWLLDGALAMTPGRDPQPFIDALEPATVANKVTPLSDFLRQQPALLDSPGRALYRSYSLVFVKWLVDSNEGRSRLAGYIDNLHRASPDPMANLRVHFPALDEDAVEKSWPARVAQFSATQGYQLLTFAETERRLGQLLTEKVNPAPSSTPRPLENLAQGRISSREAQKLKQLNQDLLVLSLRAHPIFRPTVNEYERIASRLAGGKTSGIKERLAQLGRMRARIVTRMNKVDDYMNWFEATQARTKSGAFAEYLSAAEAKNDRLRRHDAISIYMDALAEEFQD